MKPTNETIPVVQTRQTRSKRKVRFEEPVADVRPRPRREAAALEPVVVEEAAVPGEATMMEVRVVRPPARLNTPSHITTTRTRTCICTAPVHARTSQHASRVQAQSNLAAVPQEPSSTTVTESCAEATTDQESSGAMPPADVPSSLGTQEACAEATTDQLESPGPSAMPPADLPSTLGTQEACAEETADQVSPGPSTAPPSDSPSTPATLPEGDASPVASTAQTAQTAQEAGGEEPAGGGGASADAVDGQGGLRWSLMESKLDRALQALASLAASVDGRLGTVDGRLGEISTSLGTPAAWSNVWSIAAVELATYGPRRPWAHAASDLTVWSYDRLVPAVNEPWSLSEALPRTPIAPRLTTRRHPDGACARAQAFTGS